MTEYLKNDDYEIISHARIKHMHSFINDIKYRNFHLHSDYELMLVLNGDGNVRVRDTIYKLGVMDSLIINQNEIHEIESSTEPFTILMIQFSRHFCGDYFPSLRNTTFSSRLLKPLFKADEYKDFVKKLLMFSDCYIREDAFYNLTCTESLISILKAIYTHADYEIINESQYQESKKKGERLNRISAYIGSNYLYQVRLKDLADMEGVTTTHMSHIFTENFGIPFQEYMTSKRLEEAVRLSHEQKMSAVKISESCGFSDPKYLNQAFKRHFGCSYKDYIAQNILPDEQVSHSNKNVLERFLTYNESLEILARIIETP